MGRRLGSKDGLAAHAPVGSREGVPPAAIKYLQSFSRMQSGRRDGEQIEPAQARVERSEQSMRQTVHGHDHVVCHVDAHASLVAQLRQPHRGRAKNQTHVPHVLQLRELGQEGNGVEIDRGFELVQWPRPSNTSSFTSLRPSSMRFSGACD